MQARTEYHPSLLRNDPRTAAVWPLRSWQLEERVAFVPDCYAVTGHVYLSVQLGDNFPCMLNANFLKVKMALRHG